MKKTRSVRPISWFLTASWIRGPFREDSRGYSWNKTVSFIGVVFNLILQVCVMWFDETSDTRVGVHKSPTARYVGYREGR